LCSGAESVFWPLDDQPIDLAVGNLDTPAPPSANVVGPRRFGKCTHVPPHPRIVALTSFSIMSKYTFPVTLSSVKKNRPKTRLLEMAQNTFTLGLSRFISIRA
jgi:hypothetical protein